MKIKFIFYTDTHLAEKSSSRTDDYSSTILAKMQAIDDYAFNNNIDFCIHGGDTLDKAIVSRTLEQDLFEFVSNTKVPLYFTYGTHDYSVGSTTLKGKSLWYEIKRQEDKYFKIDTTTGVGCLTVDGMTIKFFTPFGNFEDETADVFIIHQMLTDGPVVFEHTDINELNLNASIVLSGDYHSGFPVKKVNNTYFSNPGALSRTFRSKDDLSREPQFAVVDTSLLPDCPITYIPISQVYKLYQQSSEVCIKFTEPALLDISAKERRNRLQENVSSAIDRAKLYRIANWEDRLKAVEDDAELAAILSADGLDVQAGCARLRELCEAREMD